MNKIFNFLRKYMSKDKKGNAVDNNTGENNSGYRNSGDRNSGDRNSGCGNSGNWNSGYWNSGDENSGNQNGGHRNSGDRNSGDRNSGYGNSTNRESGIFNSKETTIRMFNKPTDKKWNEIDHPHFNEFYLTKWIEEKDMTEEEKKNNLNFNVRQGYLKTFTYQEAWANFWKDTDEENRQMFLALPNFDKKVFFDITNIKIDDDTKGTTFGEEIELNGKKYREVNC
jgi:hypothetical protein